MGKDPHEIVVSTSNNKAYVSNAIIKGTGHVINVIDLKSLKPDYDIDTRPFYVPHGRVYWNGLLWFTTQESESVVNVRSLHPK